MLFSLGGVLHDFHLAETNMAAQEPPPPPKRLKSTTISTFFKPAAVNPNSGSGSSQVPNHAARPDGDGPITGPSNSTTEAHSIPFGMTSPGEGEGAPSSGGGGPKEAMPNVPYDIGKYVGKLPTDFEKYQLLENAWQPPPDYTYPYSTFVYKGETYKRFLSKRHLDQFPWAVLSPSAKGLLCKYCSLFLVGNVWGQKTAKPQKLVTEPLVQFKKLLCKDSDLLKHEQSKYHKECVEKAKSFLLTYHHPEAEVVNQINQQRLREVKENRERLKPIIETVIFLARQNVSFRGHRNDGLLLADTDTDTGTDLNASAVNEGNFRELLRFRIAAGDIKLEGHLQNCGARATYISKNTQNELIDCCGEVVLEKILEAVRQASEYSVIFDETTDASHKSQISLILRCNVEVEVEEYFIGFIDAFDSLSKEEQAEQASEQENDDAETEPVELNEEVCLTGEALGKIVLDKLKACCVPLGKCVGIGTDGCSVMVSEVKGAVAEVQKEATNAVRAPCFNHGLNLSICKTSKVTAIRNSVGVMQQSTEFFDQSAKRKKVLISILGHQMSGLCETRWIEKHDGTIQFSVDLPKILNALDLISNWKDINTASKASALILALIDASFLVSVMCLSDVLALSLPLSKLFQKPSLGLDSAASEIKILVEVITERRDKAPDYFKSLWTKVVNLAREIGTELKMPRRVGRQVHRENYIVGSVEEYFRVSIYIPLLDHLLSDLKSRFNPCTLQVFHLPELLPHNLLDLSSREVELHLDEIVKCFSPLLPYDEQCRLKVLEAEVQLWKKKWQNVKEDGGVIPVSSSEVLKHCDKDVYTVIHRLLSVLTVLPVSNATAERSFSALRRLKTWLRSTMSETRLSNLALIHVHRDVHISVDDVINRFAKMKNRRVEFHV